MVRFRRPTRRIRERVAATIYDATGIRNLLWIVKGGGDRPVGLLSQGEPLPQFREV